MINSNLSESETYKKVDVEYEQVRNELKTRQKESYK